ncbi:MAG: acylglycerol kinase family protein [Firmicutes bacterium]|nr:acylglycerol kinase family protein [Bacillota bacterium]
MKEQRHPPRNIAVIVNPVAGGGSARRVWPEITRLLGSFGMEFTCDFTDKPGAGTELAKRALHRGCDCVVAAGGDGTVNEVVNGLLAEGGPVKARLGIIPCGSGRDLARTLGIPRSPADAVALLAAGRTRLVDVGRIDFRTKTAVPPGATSLTLQTPVWEEKPRTASTARAKKQAGSCPFFWAPWSPFLLTEASKSLSALTVDRRNRQI